jgi:membrane protease subunit HflK
MRWLFILGGVGLACYLLTGVTFVKSGERAVVRRFGRVVDQAGAGLHVGLPWGMDRVDRVPVDLVRRVRVGYDPEAEENEDGTPPGQLLTGDHNLVNVQVVIDYTIVVGEADRYVIHADRVEDLLARAAEAGLAEWIAGHNVDDVLITGPGRLPAWLVQATQERVKPYGLGVQLTAANVTYLFPPDEVRSAFQEVTRAQTAMRTTENKAAQDAETQLRVAQAGKYRVEQDTAAHVNKQLRLAQAEADAFTARLEQYRRLKQENPDFLVALWWQEMGQLFTKMSANGRIDLLDNHLAGDGLDITQVAPS